MTYVNPFLHNINQFYDDEISYLPVRVFDCLLKNVSPKNSLKLKFISFTRRQAVVKTGSFQSTERISIVVVVAAFIKWLYLLVYTQRRVGSLLLCAPQQVELLAYTRAHKFANASFQDVLLSATTKEKRRRRTPANEFKFS